MGHFYLVFNLSSGSSRGVRRGISAQQSTSRAADSISLDGSISAQTGDVGTGWFHGPHIEWSFRFITAGG